MVTNLNFLKIEIKRIKLYFRTSQKTRREFDLTTGFKNGRLYKIESNK